MPSEVRERDFWFWTTRNARAVAASTSLTIAIAAVQAIRKMWGHLDNHFFDQWAVELLGAAQAGVLMISLAWTYFVIPTPEQAEKIEKFPLTVRRQVDRFKTAWLILILTWIIISSAYFVQDLPKCLHGEAMQQADDHNEITGFVMVLLNLFQAFVFGWMYALLTKTSWRSRYGDSGIFPWAVLFSMGATCLVSGTAFFRGSHFIVQMFIMQSLLALSISMFVGRVDSRFVRTPPWPLFLLRMYALTELFYPVALIPLAVCDEKTRPMAEMLSYHTIFVCNVMLLGFKVILVLLVSWLLDRGVLHRYILFNQIPSSLDDLSNDEFTKLMYRLKKMGKSLVGEVANPTESRDAHSAKKATPQSTGYPGNATGGQSEADTPDSAAPDKGPKQKPKKGHH